MASTVSRITGLSPGSGLLHIDVISARDTVVVAPRGELDLATADQLGATVRELRGTGFDDVVIDLRGLDFIDSTGLRLLLELRNDALRARHRLGLVAGSDEVQRLFALTQTRTLFDWRAGA